EEFMLAAPGAGHQLIDADEEQPRATGQSTDTESEDRRRDPQEPAGNHGTSTTLPKLARDVIRSCALRASANGTSTSTMALNSPGLAQPLVLARRRGADRLCLKLFADLQGGRADPAGCRVDQYALAAAHVG